MKRYAVEIGMGIDQHGQDYTSSACKAVKDAISRSCLVGLVEILKVEDLSELLIEVKVASPKPAEVDTDAVADCLPFGKKKVEVVEGGITLPGILLEDFGDRTDELVVSNAGVIVWVDT